MKTSACRDETLKNQPNKMGMTDGYNFTLFRNQFPYIWQSFCVGVRKILPIYMGKPEYHFVWGYTQSLPNNIGGILCGVRKIFPIYGNRYNIGKALRGGTQSFSHIYRKSFV